MNTTRVFVAVEVSSAVLERAADLIERLRTSGAPVKWVDPSKMHLTLKFLGDVAQADLAGVYRGVAQAAAQHTPFGISLAGAGAFPNPRRPRTLWIGVDRGADVLCELQVGIDKSLKKVGFPKEQRRFHPHLTIGRIRHGGSDTGRLANQLREFEQFDAGTATIRDVVVFASHLTQTGPNYEVLSRSPLGSAS
jgi:2'-5' RNA ligase